MARLTTAACGPWAAIVTVCLLATLPQLHVSARETGHAESQVSELGGSIQARSLLKASDHNTQASKKCENKCEKKKKSSLAACNKKHAKDARARKECHKKTEKKHKSCKKECKRNHHHHHKDVATVYWAQPPEGHNPITESSPGCWNLYPNAPVCFKVGACHLQDGSLYCMSGPLKPCGTGPAASDCLPDSYFDSDGPAVNICDPADPANFPPTGDCNDEGAMCRMISGRKRCYYY